MQADSRIDRIPCGILTFDGHSRIVSANETMLRMLSRSRDEVESHPIDVIFPKGGRIFFQTHFLPLIRMHGGFTEVYFELLRRDGEKIPVLINAMQRDEEGSDLTDCAFVVVSQRERYEEALLQARREADKANVAKVKFLSMISHDLRTPLQAIAGYASVLSEGFHGDLNEEQMDAVKAIEMGGRELRLLIDDILNFVTLDSGSVSVSLEVVGVNDALQRAETLVRLRMKDNGIGYTREPVNEDALVRADPNRLQQVLLNLLTNAAKFTPSGGKVVAGFEHEGDRGRIYVRDTGRGIPPEKLEAIFEPFTQVDESDRVHGGVGLGLAISRGLVQAMGGELSAESVPGEGSTFTIDLPLATPDTGDSPSRPVLQGREA